MRSYRRRHLSILLGSCGFLLALAGCRADGLVDGPMAVVVLRGTVTDTLGNPVAAAVVRVAWRPGDTCTGLLASGPASITDGDGRYVAQLGEWGAEFRACVRVIAEPPQLAPLWPDSTVRSGVNLRSVGTPDTVTIDVVLRPSA
jgi:hypothetical protein